MRPSCSAHRPGRATAKHGLASARRGVRRAEGGPAIALRGRRASCSRDGAAPRSRPPPSSGLATRLRPLPVPLRGPQPWSRCRTARSPSARRPQGPPSTPRSRSARPSPACPSPRRVPHAAARRERLDPVARPCGSAQGRAGARGEGDVVVATAVADVVTRGTTARVVVRPEGRAARWWSEPSSRLGGSARHRSPWATSTSTACPTSPRGCARDDVRARDDRRRHAARRRLEPRRAARAAGVRALALCGPEAEGRPALVAVVADEVWFVR